MNPRENKVEAKITVKHPEYGHVEFRGLTTRQKEILKEYDKLTKSNKKNKTSIHKRRND